MGDLVQAGPYRQTAQEQVRAARLAPILVELRRAGVSDSSFGWLVDDIRSLDVFESVARGDVTAEDGAWLLCLQRRGFPWYVRLALWLWARSADEVSPR